MQPTPTEKLSLSAQVQELLRLPVSAVTPRDLQELRTIFNLVRSSQGSILDESTQGVPAATAPAAPKAKEKPKKPRGAAKRPRAAAAAAATNTTPPVPPPSPRAAVSRHDEDEPPQSNSTGTSPTEA